MPDTFQSEIHTSRRMTASHETRLPQELPISGYFELD
jgi:hypothetical protein